MFSLIVMCLNKLLQLLFPIIQHFFFVTKQPMDSPIYLIATKKAPIDFEKYHVAAILRIKIKQEIRFVVLL